MYIDAYHTSFSGTVIHSLFAFDLTPDLSAHLDIHWNLVKKGSVRIDVRFDDSLSSTVNCIIYAEYE